MRGTQVQEPMLDSTQQGDANQSHSEVSPSQNGCLPSGQKYMLTGTQGGPYSLLVGVEITPAIMEKKAGLPQEAESGSSHDPRHGD